MKRFSRMLFLSSLISLVSAGTAIAQTPPSPTFVNPSPNEPAPSVTSLTPLKIQVTIARFQGEKKVSSIPFTLSVTANDGQTTTFNNGQNVPVPAGPAGSLTYQSIGTSINASAAQTSDRRFRLTLTVTDSSIASTARETRGPISIELANAPVIKSLTVTNRLLLRDGQASEFLASTDQLNGEVTRIEVLLTVLK